MNTTQTTPLQASVVFTKKAKEIALENSLDFADAWTQAKQDFPQLHAQAFGAMALANSQETGQRKINAIDQLLPEPKPCRTVEEFLNREKNTSVALENATVPFPRRAEQQPPLRDRLIQLFSLTNDAPPGLVQSMFAANDAVSDRVKSWPNVFNEAVSWLQANKCLTQGDAKKHVSEQYPVLYKKAGNAMDDDNHV
jgi:hypothetical protein